MYSIGLMSGTSMDGIDVALLETNGESEIKDLGHDSMSYDPKFKILLKAAEYAVYECKGNLEEAKKFYPVAINAYLKNAQKTLDIHIPGKIKELSAYLHGDNFSNQPITFDQVVQHSTQLHATAVKKLLEKTNHNAEKIDVIGYHGQTLFHNPLQKITIQVGDGQALANLLGITVVNDFRSRDVAMGGQGAPFAPLFHQALAIRDKKFPLAVVNCGGIANITLIRDASENNVIGFDTGPGNGLVDRYVQHRTKGTEVMDKDGKYGKKGKVDNDILEALRDSAVIQHNENFLNKKPPKSLDINDLQLTSEIKANLDRLSLKDACITLEAFTANTIVDSLELLGIKPKHWVLAGGGWKNPVILEKLTERIKERIGKDVEIKTADEFGWNSQAMEAQIFAYFAVRSLKNLPLSVPGTTGVLKPLSGGRAYRPENKNPTSIVKELLKQNPDVLLGVDLSP